jgi:uncharacterized protein (AIM24 family)
MDWGIILSVSACIATCLVVVGVMVYTDMQYRLNNSDALAFKPGVKFDAQKLDTTLSQFDERAKERVLLRTGYGDVSDPSLP